MKPYLKITYVFILCLLTALVGCNEDDFVPAPVNGLVAKAGEDKTGKVGESLTLDGSASFDKNNKPFTHEWSVKTKPQGSTIILDVSQPEKASFTPDVVGLYTIQLRISQGSWFSVDDVLVTALAADPNQPQEPTAVTISQNISEARTLSDIFEDPAVPDYIVTEDVEVRGDLTIEPGVVIYFAENKSLQIVSGTISAKGTSDKGIVFRGMTNSPAYWKGILIYSNSASNEFDYVTVKQGGSNLFTDTGTRANVALAGTQHSGGALKISHSKFSEGGGIGLYVQGGSQLNYFANNVFSNNAFAAVYVPAGQIHMIDKESMASNNGLDGIETGGQLPEGVEVQWKKVFNGTYRVKNHITIRGGVTVEPGVSFKMHQNVTIEVLEHGYLSAVGTESSRIIFDAANIGFYWNGLYFNSPNQNNKLQFVEVSHAGLNKMGEAAYTANVFVSYGNVVIANSIIKNGLGYGVVTKELSYVNQDLSLVNQFQNLQKGSVYPTILNYPDRPSIIGTWVDQWTFNQNTSSITPDFYNQNTETWFGGAANPWAINNAGFGIQFNENGTFTWNIAEHSPMVGCESYSAEYIIGNAFITNEVIKFNQNYWRSKFVNACDETQNVETGVTPFEVSLPYELIKKFNALNGETYWELKFKNADGSTFSFYRKA